MIYRFIKNFFLFFLGFYSYTKLVSGKRSITYIQATCYSIFLAILTAAISVKLSTIYFPLTLPFYFLALYILSHKQSKFSLIYAIMSIYVSYAIFSIMMVPTSLIFFMFRTKPMIEYISWATLIIGILSSLTIILLLNNKRIQRALHLLCNYQNFYICAFLVFSFMLIVAIAQSKIQDTGNSKIYSISLVLVALILLYIIQRETQKYYLSKLKKLELESLRQELAEKDAFIRKLQESNDNLARIIHKDNKLIPSMESAVHRFLRDSYVLDPDKLRASGATLAAELEQLAQTRQGILTSYEDIKDGLPHTGHAAVDAILSHMRDRARSLHITYNVTLSADFTAAIDQIIPEADLTHLLADLIENAIIAAKDSDSRSILVHLGTLYDAPVVEVSDSGKPFEPAVYQDFGLQKHSTHLDAGGSGIGLMDIWELKKKYAASLHIHEYAPDTASYTKKISIVFDKRKHYLIRTYRPQELLLYRTRTDMYILPLE